MIRWGFLGAGGISTRALGPAVHAADGAVLQAAAARDPARASALRPAGAVYADYAELLADPDVDAVYIGLANDAHRPWTLAALSAGRPVLCEKPLALSAGEVDEIAAASAVAGCAVVEASWYRWHPRIRLAQRLLADGAIGPARQVSTGFTFGGVPAGNYRLEPARGGGALYDVGCYAVSAALWAFAATPAASGAGGVALPIDLVARSTYGDTRVDLASELIVRFADGEAQVRAGIAEPDRQWLVIRGDEGEIELRDSPYTAWVGRDTELWLSRGRSTERMQVAATDAYQLMVEEVSSALSGGDGWLLPLAESRACAAVLDAAFASARAGGEPRPVEPPRAPAPPPR